LQREGKTEKEGKVKEEKNNTFISKKSFTFWGTVPQTSYRGKVPRLCP